MSQEWTDEPTEIVADDAVGDVDATESVAESAPEPDAATASQGDGAG